MIRPGTGRGARERLRHKGFALFGALVALSACGAATTAAAPRAAVSVVPWAQTTPLADPAAYAGPTTARLAATSGDPLPTPTPTLPTTVTDHQGTKVTITSADRVLALDVYGTLARTVDALGLGGNLVGRDQSTDLPDLPQVTHGAHVLDPETVLSLHPTVLLTDTTIGPFSAVLQIRAAGVPVVIVDPTRSLATVGPITEQVADALGVHQAGVDLTQRLQQQVAAERAQIAKVAPRTPLRVVFLYVRGRQGVYDVFGQGSGADSLIAAVGATDVATAEGIKGFTPLNAEALARTRPDVILMMSDGLASVGGVDGALTLPGVAQTPAGSHRRIVDMDDFALLGFGPRTPAVLDALARALYAPASVT